MHHYMGSLYGIIIWDHYMGSFPRKGPSTYIIHFPVRAIEMLALKCMANQLKIQRFTTP